LTACGDGTVRLWSPPGGQPLDTSFLHKGVNAVAFSPDGRTFLTASSTGWKQQTIHLWGLRRGPESRTLPDRFNFLAFGPDGQTVLAGSPDDKDRRDKAEARLLDLATGKPLGKGVPHDGFVHGGDFSPDGKTVVTCDTRFGGGLAPQALQYRLRLWDAATGKALTSIEVETARYLAFIHDGKTLVTGSLDGAVKLWDAATGRLKRTIPLPGKKAEHGGPECFSISPDGRTMAT